MQVEVQKCIWWCAGHIAIQYSGPSENTKGYTLSLTLESQKEQGPSMGKLVFCCLKLLIALSAAVSCAECISSPWTGRTAAGFSCSEEGSWTVVGCGLYPCPGGSGRPGYTLAMAVVSTYTQTSESISYGSLVACSAGTQDGCKTACTKMPLCRGITTGSQIMFLMGDGSLVSSGAILARCGSQTVPCPGSTITFEMSESVDISSGPLVLDSKNVDIVSTSVEGNNFVVSVSNARVDAYVRIPVPRSPKETDNTKTQIIVFSVVTPCIIALGIFHLIVTSPPK